MQKKIIKKAPAKKVGVKKATQKKAAKLIPSASGISLIKKTSDYLLINKPIGVIVHPDGKTKEGTVVDWLMENYPDVKGVGETMKLYDGSIIDRPGIVHRLDRDTTGILVVARTQKMYDHLKEQFQNKTIEKHYRAFVYGFMKTDHDGTESERIVDMPIARAKNDFRRWTAERGMRGGEREAVTIFTPLAQAQCKFENKGGKGAKGISGSKAAGIVYEPVSFVDAFPKTGRTHQIRVHAKAINNPVVADELYAPQKPHLLGFERQALHAYSLSFTDLKGKTVTGEAPYPPDFMNAFKEAGINEKNLDLDIRPRAR